MQITSTPCISLCRIDGGSGCCIGCGRTAAEIGAWVAMDEPHRLALMAALPQRFDAMPALAAAREAWTQALAMRMRVGRRRRLGDFAAETVKG